MERWHKDYWRENLTTWIAQPLPYVTRVEMDIDLEDLAQEGVIGLLVATSRLIFPRPRLAAGACEASSPGQAQAQNEDEPLPVAA